MSSWGEGWAGGVTWGLLSSHPGRWPGGRAVLPAGTYLVSRLMATSLCVSSSTWIKKRSCFWACRRLDHHLVKWTSCCLKRRDYLSVWSFFPDVPIPQLNFFPILFLLYVFWISRCLCTRRRGLVLPYPISGSVLRSWLKTGGHLLRVCWSYSPVSI